MFTNFVCEVNKISDLTLAFKGNDRVCVSTRVCGTLHLNFSNNEHL